MTEINKTDKELVPLGITPSRAVPKQDPVLCTDEDIIRIRSKIMILNNILKQGTISMVINMIVSYIVTLEVTNGVEKITIQEILAIIKQKIADLNKFFDELMFAIKDVQDLKIIETYKQTFRKRVYKLFDIKDLINILVVKCVSLGFGLKKLLPLFNTSYIDYLTISIVDSMLFTETQDDFETKIHEYINERTTSIEDPVARKLSKIDMLYNILNTIVGEKIDITKTLPSSIKHIDNSSGYTYNYDEQTLLFKQNVTKSNEEPMIELMDKTKTN